MKPRFVFKKASIFDTRAWTPTVDARVAAQESSFEGYAASGLAAMPIGERIGTGPRRVSEMPSADDRFKCVQALRQTARNGQELLGNEGWRLAQLRPRPRADPVMLPAATLWEPGARLSFVGGDNGPCRNRLSQRSSRQSSTKGIANSVTRSRTNAKKLGPTRNGAGQKPGNGGSKMGNSLKTKSGTKRRPIFSFTSRNLYNKASKRVPDSVFKNCPKICPRALPLASAKPTPSRHRGRN